MASLRFGHVAAHPDTRNRCEGKVQESTGANMRSWSTYRRGVGPVVRDLLLGVEPHRVGRAARARRRLRAGGLVGMPHADVPLDLERSQEPVHAPTVDIRRGRLRAVRSAAVHRVAVVVRTPARTVRIGHARRERPVGLAWDAVGAREGPEVVIERPVLLDDEDQVIEVHDPGIGVDRPERVQHLGGRGRVRQRSGVDPQRRPVGQHRVLIGEQERQGCLRRRRHGRGRGPRRQVDLRGGRR